jgi:SAM-dependent methyltransferase
MHPPRQAGCGQQPLANDHDVLVGFCRVGPARRDENVMIIARRHDAKPVRQREPRSLGSAGDEFCRVAVRRAGLCRGLCGVRGIRSGARPEHAAARIRAAARSGRRALPGDIGKAEQLSEPDDSVAAIWCRDVLEHVPDLAAVFGEFRRVLRPDGHAVIYQMTATDWLEPAEAERLWPPVGIYADSVDPANFDAAVTGSGLTITQCIELHGGESATRRTATT